MLIDVQLDKGAEIPNRAHELDAGSDLFSMESVVIPPHSSVVIDTGTHVAIPEGYAGLLVSKSGLNVLCGVTSTGLIDSGYTGAIKVRLYNNSNNPYVVNRGDKVTQLVIFAVASPTWHVVDRVSGAERGDAGFGSTGR